MITEDGPEPGGGNDEVFYAAGGGGGGSPYRVQRQAANIRERKRMLRSDPQGRRTGQERDRPPVKM